MNTYLSQSTLAQISPAVLTPDYDRRAAGMGVVHFGPGAFHRAHQAFFLDRLLREDPRWGICAVSLRNPATRDALAPQDNLYALAELDAAVSFRVIGALREVLVATESGEAVLSRLCAPSTHVVTLTVTEKGYCLDAAGNLDTAHADIRHDLAAPHEPVSVIGFLVEAFARRRAAGLPALTVISCDNLADNGARLARATVQLAAARDQGAKRDRGLPGWINDQAAFPCTMVDSITPATTDALKRRVAAALGVEDRWPVQREAFVQWVIERRFCGEVPDWEAAGVIVTDDVAAYEQAKLRLLNGAHSTLAYTGLLAGYETVSEAMNDPHLAAFVRTLMTQDILGHLRAPRGLDLLVYVDAILLRFHNTEIRHALAQIAWDGSQKLPFRIFGTIRDALTANSAIDRLCVPIAAWMHFVRRQATRGIPIIDPLADTLHDIGARCTGRASTDVPLFLKLELVFTSDLVSAPIFTSVLAHTYDRLASATFNTSLYRQLVEDRR